jgi:hypothetical protein
MRTSESGLLRVEGVSEVDKKFKKLNFNEEITT